MNPRTRQYYREAFDHWHIVAGLTLVVVLVLFGFWQIAGQPAAEELGVEPDIIVPTTGEQGFPVYEFCDDSATQVTHAIVAPESEFSAAYELNRQIGGVHELVRVNVYKDSDREPVGVHFDSQNNDSDAFVSKKAMDCIERKVK